MLPEQFIDLNLVARYRVRYCTCFLCLKPLAFRARGSARPSDRMPDPNGATMPRLRRLNCRSTYLPSPWIESLHDKRRIGGLTTAIRLVQWKNQVKRLKARS